MQKQFSPYRGEAVAEDLAPAFVQLFWDSDDLM